MITPDPYAALRDQVLQHVLEGPAETPAEVRKGAAERIGTPVTLQPLIDKIHAHAYRVTDADVSALQTVYGEDGAFEIIVSAALGASRERLLAGLAALEQV